MDRRWFSWVIVVLLLGLSACPSAPVKEETKVEALPPEPTQEATADKPTEATAELSPEAPEARLEIAQEPATEVISEPQPDAASEPTAEIASDSKAEAIPEVQAEPISEATLPETSGPLTLAIADPKDIVASYLIGPSAWNYFSGATVPLGRHSGTGNPSFHTAFRFPNVTIPPNATILSASLSFLPHNEVDSNNRLMIHIFAEKTPNSAAYDPTNTTQGRPDQRLKTTAKIDRWIVRCNDACSDDIHSPKYEYDCPQRKKDCWDRTKRYQVPKDLKAIVQEVISQPGWNSGGAISLFLINAATDQDGSSYKGSRTIIGLDPAQAASAPRLLIDFR